MALLDDEAYIGRCNFVTEQIIGAAIEVHRHTGAGCLETAYEACLCRELALRGLRFEPQIAVPLEYKGVKLDCGFRLDMVVDDLIVVEIKAVEKILAIHEAQLLTYLRLTNRYLGLLLNFNEMRLKDGIRRVVNGAVTLPL